MSDSFVVIENSEFGLQMKEIILSSEKITADVLVNCNSFKEPL